jgi:hypothetical protein
MHLTYRLLTSRQADMYMNAVTDGANAALRARPGQLPAPPLVDAPSTAPATNITDPSAPTGVVVPPVATPDDPDAAPASAPSKPKTPPPPEIPTKGDTSEVNKDISNPQDNVSATPVTNGNGTKGEGKAGDNE